MKEYETKENLIKVVRFIINKLVMNLPLNSLFIKEAQTKHPDEYNFYINFWKREHIRLKNDIAYYKKELKKIENNEPTDLKIPVTKEIWELLNNQKMN